MFMTINSTGLLTILAVGYLIGVGTSVGRVILARKNRQKS